MKRSTISFALSLVMAIGFAVSCGKDSKGGNGGGGVNGLITSGLPQSSVDVVSSFNSWYTSANEGSGGLVNSGYLGTAGNYELTRSASTGSTGGNCEQKPIKVFGTTIGYYTVCSSASSSGSTNGVKSTVTVTAGQAKSINATLASIAASAAGTLVDAQFNGQAYNLAFKRADNSVVVYVIDVRYHSAFQPMQVIEIPTSGQSTTTTLTYIQKLN